MKKTVRVLITALAIALFLAFPSRIAANQRADAGDTCTITIQNGQGEYAAYQIFTGKLSQDGDDWVLADLSFGSGIAEAAFRQMDAFSSLAMDAAAVEYADVLAAMEETELRAFASALILENVLAEPSGTSLDGTIGNLTSGYYLIKNTKTDSMATTAILEVVKDTTVEPKAGTVPTVAKTVKDTGNSSDGYSDSADLSFLETLPFQIEATVPQGLEYYTGSGYTFIIHDVTSQAIVPAYESLQVYAKIQDQLTLVEDASSYSVTVSEDGKSARIAIADLPNSEAFAAAQSIVVRYNGQFEESLKPELGKTEYEGSAWVEYTTDPYAAESSARNTAASGTSLTKESVAVVFNYTLQVTKTDESQNPLSGAEFTIKATAGNQNYAYKGEVSQDDSSIFTFYGLRDGVAYTLEETQAPASYNKAADVAFTISNVGHIVSGSTDVLVSEGAFTVSDQLDYDNDQKLLSVEIQNKKGTVLPSTGGTGTLLFMGGGMALLVMAGLFLITNKRIAKESL